MRTRALPLALALWAAACAEPLQALPPGASAAPERTLEVRAVGPDGPVAGASICAAGVAASGERCAATGSEGKARLRLAASTYVVRVSPPEKSRLEVTRQSVDLTMGDTSVSIPILGRAVIGGTVRDDAGAAVAGADACAHATADEATTCAKTDAGGRYRIGLRPGTYKIELTSPPGAKLVTQWARGRVDSFEADIVDVRVRDDEAVDVTLVRGFVLSGTVRAARDGRPLKEAEVCSQTLAEPLPWDCERTDKTGAFRLLRMPGRYWLWFIPSDADGETLRYQRYDGVDLGVDATPFDLDRDASVEARLPEGPRIVGRVTVDDGSPVAGAEVCVDTPFPTGRICRETHGDGTFAVATRPETYALQVVPPAGSRAVSRWWRDARDWKEADPVVVRSGDTRVDVVMTKGFRLTGLVLTPEGIPVESASMNVSDARGFVGGAYTDHRGRYEVAVPRGDLAVDAFAPRIAELQSVLGTRLRVDADTTHDVTLPRAAP